jgi:hypothetical protein
MLPLLLFLIVLTALFETTESLSDRPNVAPPSATAVNRIADIEEGEARSTATATSSTMASLSPKYACLVKDPLPEMPLLPITSEATVRACRAMKISSRDVFVCSYPKSGTTWTQNIIVRLLWEIASGNNNNNNNSSSRPLPEDWHLSHSAPFYEVDQYWQRSQKDSKSTNDDQDEEEPMERLAAKTPILNEKENEYRVFNTHLLPHQLPPNAKCVYVVRDPLDVMLSFYHHLSNQAVEDGGYTGTFEEFFEGFLEGTIVYGKWQDHIEAWLGNGVDGTDKERNFLLLHYEDMKKDLAKETKRLAKFLVDDNNGESSENRKTFDDRCLDEIVSRVVPHCTFDAMKRERKRYTPLTVSWKTNPKTGKPYDKFVRKGNIGDGRKILLETPSSSSSTLKDRWIDRDVPIAEARWKKAGVEQEIVDRYL